MHYRILSTSPVPGGRLEISCSGAQFVAESGADEQRCQDAESKIDLIAEWINEVTNNSGNTNSEGTEVNLPPLMIDDFSPALGSSSQMPNTNTILSSGISQLNLAKLSHLKGTLTMGRKGLGLGSMGGSGMGMGMGRMLREESQFDLAGTADDSF